MKVGDKVRSTLKGEPFSHRKGRIVEIRDRPEVKLFIVRFEGTIIEQPFIFHEHELEVIS